MSSCDGYTPWSLRTLGLATRAEQHQQRVGVGTVAILDSSFDFVARDPYRARFSLVLLHTSKGCYSIIQKAAPSRAASAGRVGPGLAELERKL